MGTHETKAAAKEREAQRDRVNGDARAKHQPHVAERRSKGTAAQGQRLRRRTAEQSRRLRAALSTVSAGLAS